MSAFRVPVQTLLAVTAHMRDAQIQQVVRATNSARQNVLDIRAFSAVRVEAERTIADEAFAHPRSSITSERVVRLGNVTE